MSKITEFYEALMAVAGGVGGAGLNDDYCHYNNRCGIFSNEWYTESYCGNPELLI
jgi:hypothetical protein